MEKKVFEEIENWKLEAKLEDVARYFYHTKAVGKIENGSCCYVIGRKGSGKTAISEYIHKKMDAKKLSKNLLLRTFRSVIYINIKIIVLTRQMNI